MCVKIDRNSKKKHFPILTGSPYTYVNPPLRKADHSSLTIGDMVCAAIEYGINYTLF